MPPRSSSKVLPIRKIARSIFDGTSPKGVQALPIGSPIVATVECEAGGVLGEQWGAPSVLAFLEHSDGLVRLNRRYTALQ